jgi:DnaJ-class molecular chaperone
MSDVYDVLGIARDAGPAQIKSAYRRLAKVYHPDVRGGDGRAERRFKEIARAYETLSRPEIRAAYDAGWASARAVARRRVRSIVTTMCASFALTIASGLLLAAWMRSEALF